MTALTDPFLETIMEQHWLAFDGKLQGDDPDAARLVYADLS